MFGIQVLDVAIGLIFIYLLLSLMVTAANELLASWLKRRSATLWRGIVALLGDESAANKLYGHPLIKGLTSQAWLAKRREGLPFQQRPSYIPSRTFALALLDSIAPTTAATGHTLQNVKAALALRLSAQGEDAMARSIAVLLDDAGEDLEKFKANLETWFNNGMDRVTGWYKRRTQYILVVLSLVLTVWMNADTLSLAGTLWRDPAVRTALVAQAQQTSAQKEGVKANDSIEQLKSLAIPLGWRETKPGNWDEWCRAIDDHFFGWLLTALAISMGSPFWFDMLNRVITIRGTGKPPETKKQ